MGGKALNGKRIVQSEVEPLVNAIFRGEYTKGNKALVGYINFEIAGSYRRNKPDCGDIDIVICLNDINTIDDWLKDTFGLQANGKKPAHVGLVENVQVEFYLSKSEDFGAQLQMWTGSMQENIRLRGIAKKKGFSLSQYGAKNILTGEITKFAFEKQVYEFLNIPFVIPEKR